jgi:pectate lyase
MIIRNFCAQDFGKLYRSCGNCNDQYKRTSIFENIVLRAPGGTVAGVNTNYGDRAEFHSIYTYGGASGTICERYTGNNTGAEPMRTGAGNDGTYCVYATSDIIRR